MEDEGVPSAEKVADALQNLLDQHAQHMANLDRMIVKRMSDAENKTATTLTEINALIDAINSMTVLLNVQTVAIGQLTTYVLRDELE